MSSSAPNGEDSSETPPSSSERTDESADILLAMLRNDGKKLKRKKKKLEKKKILDFTSDGFHSFIPLASLLTVPERFVPSLAQSEVNIEGKIGSGAFGAVSLLLLAIFLPPLLPLVHYFRCTTANIKGKMSLSKK